MADDLPANPHFADGTVDCNWDQRLLRSGNKQDSPAEEHSPNLLQFNSALRRASRQSVPDAPPRRRRLKGRSSWLKALYSRLSAVRAG